MLGEPGAKRQTSSVSILTRASVLSVGIALYKGLYQMFDYRKEIHAVSAEPDIDRQYANECW